MSRLHVGLIKAGIESRILCRRKKLPSSDSSVIPKTKLLAPLESQLQKLTSRLGLNDIHCLSTFNIVNTESYIKADVLHLHCIHGGFFNYLALPRLTATKPAVFTLHDIWPFTGHCAYSYDCDRWKAGCGHCPYPKNYPPIRRDGTALEWKLKNRAYSRSRMVIVSPSSILTKQAKQSMLSRFPIQMIPHGIDTSIFRPLDRNACRQVLGIPNSKRVLMFGSMALNANNKGGDLLIRAIQCLPKRLKDETVLLVFGEGGESLQRNVGIETHNLGYIDQDPFKVIAYSAADIFVQPSRAESFSLVVQESMACGTPVVAFSVGGIVDLVRPEITGYLAKVEDAEDLSCGIRKLFRNDSLRQQMGLQCRQIVVDEYSLELQVQRHIELYRQLI